MINYLKAYFEPKSRTLRKMAFESARGYFKDKPKTMVEFQAYQRGYINAYRRTYAQNKLKKGVA